MKSEIKEITNRLNCIKGITINNERLVGFVYYEGVNKFSLQIFIGNVIDGKTMHIEMTIDAVLEFLKQKELACTAPSKSETTQKVAIHREPEEKFNDVRSILFDTMKDLKDKKIDPNVGKEISAAAQTYINTFKVEVDIFKAVNKL